MDRAAFGVGLILLGAFFFWGGVSGRLAPMLAALFSPEELVSAGSSSALRNSSPGLLQSIGQDIENFAMGTLGLK
jgi:hypothetical protein